jgi:uncharacterized protein DUF4375
MPSSSLTPHIRRILSVAPGDPSVIEETHAISHLMIVALRQGRAAGERLVESLADDGFVLERVDVLPCMWLVKTPPPRVLELWFTGGEDPVIGSLSYRVGKPWGSPKQRAVLKLQTEFYSRYETLGARREAVRLTPRDRLILLVGDFEADVNNGGFDQYLGNKGLPTAREALRALKTIGAKRTAGWLTAALEAPGDREALDRLDAAFHERPEDVAALVMRSIAKQRKRSRPRPKSKKR